MQAKTLFIDLLEKVNRPGVDELIKYLEEQTDFFTAPCSTKYHLSREGGLVEHSVNVTYELRDLANFYELDIPKDSILVVGLLHDLCKVNSYKPCEVSVPPDKSGTGKWEKVPGWRKVEDLLLGHGAKSLSIVQDFIQLTDEEKQAIYWHMGTWDTSQYSSSNMVGRVYEQNKLAFLLHMADEVSTFITEA